jgi:NAD(P)-dependent dehydrogenase (short-subunit alcohol dehydrogenase family)
VFVTGSADGLGLMAGRLLADEGHAVVLHARDDGRARIAAEALPAAERAQAYADSKLFDLLLAFGVARWWPDVLVNAVSPGWVATRMGGAGAPDDLDAGPVTQAWLAVSDDPAARTTAGYFYHRRPVDPPRAARDAAAQDALLEYCAELTGTPLPG